MHITYTVHSAVREQVATKAMVGSREIDASVPGLIVEMTAGDKHGHTWQFVPATDAEMQEAETMFVPGSTVVVTFTSEGDA